MTVRQEAEEQLAATRREQQVEESQYLLSRRERLKREIEEINMRLDDLDEGADPKTSYDTEMGDRVVFSKTRYKG